MHTQQIHNIAKNQSYTHYFQIWMAGDNPSGMRVGRTDITPAQLNISKDGGAYTTTTNNFSNVGNGLYKIVLTADEMNANVVSLYFPGQSSGYGGYHALIDTGVPVKTDAPVKDKQDIPKGDLTVEQIFELLAKRLKRTGRRI